MSLLRVGPLVRRRLVYQARRDARATRSGANGSGYRSDETTATIAELQARANAYARREEQRFLVRARHELAEQRELTQTLAADLAAYDNRLDALPPTDRTAARITEGDGAAFEELRRLRRHITRRTHRAEQLGVAIHARFSAARLRANRHFDRSDEKIAVYWGAYLHAQTSTPDTVQAPALHRADSLAGRDASIDLWHPLAPTQSARESGLLVPSIRSESTDAQP